MEFRSSRTQAFGIAIVCLAFLLPLAYTLRMDVARNAYVPAAFEAIGMLLFGSLFLFAVWRFFVPTKTPAMVIDAKGIKGWISKGYVPWSRIVFLWVKKDDLPERATFADRLTNWLMPRRVIVCRYTPDRTRKLTGAKAVAKSAALTPDHEDYDDHDVEWIEATIRFTGWTPGIDAAIATIRSLHASKLVYEKPKDAALVNHGFVDE